MSTPRRRQRSPYLDVFGDLLFVYDGEGTLLEWNEAVEQTTGRDAAALERTVPTDLFEGTDADRVAGTVAEALEAGRATTRATLVTAGGDAVPVEYRVSRLPDGSGPPGFAVIARELDGSVALERDRNAALERMHDAVFAVDADWRLTYANDGAARILSTAMDRDCDADALVGCQLWQERPDGVEAAFYENCREAMVTGEQATFEAQYPPLDAWFDARVFPSGTELWVYLRDVTDRRRRQDASDRQARALRAMYEIVSDRDRSFDEKVDALLALGRAELGFDYGTLSRIQGDQYVFEKVDADDGSIEAGDVVPTSATNCEIVASTEESLALGDIAAEAPAETTRAGYAEWGISCYVGTPVFVDDEVYGTFCFYDTEARSAAFAEWEVTLVDLMGRWVSYELEHQQHTERLTRQNEQLEQFTSFVSHDLRSPLNALEGWLQVAREEGDAEAFERCQRSVDRMNALVEDLLTLARSGDRIDDLEPVELARTATDAWGNVPTADAALTVTTAATVRGDRRRLLQLFENLFRNSVEHGGATVTVTVGDLPDRPGFFVEDDGPGIPEPDSASVFENGYTTNTGGTGLGLAIVEEVANAHGFDVTATEGSEGGARFVFTERESDSSQR